uniref:CCT domain-containing protein n=1 Tax=Oryza glumipatula TaxID=40148 RepID=A0A0E0AQ86_9ORYZ
MASGGARRRKGRRGGRGNVKRRTKYLSLSRFLIKKEEEEEVVVVAVRSPELVPKEEAPSSPEDGGDGGEEEEEKPQMEPFALHPEPSTLFAAAPSLTDILGASAGGGGGGGGESSSAASPGVSDGKELSGEEDDLARRALRGRERWVYCSSSSPSATTTTTTTTSSSCSSAASTGASSGGAAARSLLLKLDYEEILAAWAGRGSLYIGGAAAATATAGGADNAAAELELDSVFVEVSASPEPAAAAVAWSVAEPAARAEKVRRYKEKRQGRLFAKRIRYEVRRLNAVRRPRLKLEQMLPVAVEPLHAPFCRRCKSSVSSRE